MSYRVTSYFLFTALALYTSCTDTPADNQEAPQLRFDSLSTEAVSAYLATHYDQPIGIDSKSIYEGLVKEGDRFFLRDRHFVLRLNETDYQYDSVIFSSLGLAPPPPYDPANPPLDTVQNPGERLSLTVDMGAFGSSEVMLYEVSSDTGTYIAARYVLHVDQDCLPFLVSPFTTECITLKSQSSRQINEQEYEAIRDYYYSSDLNRTSYYDHQGRIICDGYSYRLRYRYGDTDKALYIPCPGPQNPMVVLCDRIDAVFAKQLHVPLR